MPTSSSHLLSPVAVEQKANQQKEKSKIYVATKVTRHGVW